jgi:hypothetical protein
MGQPRMATDLPVSGRELSAGTSAAPASGRRREWSAAGLRECVCPRGDIVVQPPTRAFVEPLGSRRRQRHLRLRRGSLWRPNAAMSVSALARDSPPMRARAAVRRRSTRIASSAWGRRRGIADRADELLAERDQHPLPRGVTPHKLRHTFASILIALGRDPRYVMEQVGHTDPKFTLRIYAHVMRFSDEERARLKALAEGQVLAGIGSEPSRGSLRNVELPMGAAGLEPATSRV